MFTTTAHARPTFFLDLPFELYAIILAFVGKIKDIRNLCATEKGHVELQKRLHENGRWSSVIEQSIWYNITNIMVRAQDLFESYVSLGPGTDSMMHFPQSLLVFMGGLHAKYYNLGLGRYEKRVKTFWDYYHEFSDGRALSITSGTAVVHAFLIAVLLHFLETDTVAGLEYSDMDHVCVDHNFVTLMSKNLLTAHVAKNDKYLQVANSYCLDKEFGPDEQLDSSVEPTVAATIYPILHILQLAVDFSGHLAASAESETGCRWVSNNTWHCSPPVRKSQLEQPEKDIDLKLFFDVMPVAMGDIYTVPMLKSSLVRVNAIKARLGPIPFRPYTNPCADSGALSTCLPCATVARWALRGNAFFPAKQEECGPAVTKIKFSKCRWFTADVWRDGQDTLSFYNKKLVTEKIRNAKEFISWQETLMDTYQVMKEEGSAFAFLPIPFIPKPDYYHMYSPMFRNVKNHPKSTRENPLISSEASYYTLEKKGTLDIIGLKWRYKEVIMPIPLDDTPSVSKVRGFINLVDGWDPVKFLEEQLRHRHSYEEKQEYEWESRFCNNRYKNYYEKEFVDLWGLYYDGSGGINWSETVESKESVVRRLVESLDLKSFLAPVTSEYYGLIGHLDEVIKQIIT